MTREEVYERLNKVFREIFIVEHKEAVSIPNAT